MIVARTSAQHVVRGVVAVDRVVPDGVVACAAFHHVRPAPAVDRVRPGPSSDVVAAGAAVDGVVAGPSAVEVADVRVVVALHLAGDRVPAAAGPDHVDDATGGLDVVVPGGAHDGDVPAEARGRRRGFRCLG